MVCGNRKDSHLLVSIHCGLKSTCKDLKNSWGKSLIQLTLSCLFVYCQSCFIVIVHDNGPFSWRTFWHVTVGKAQVGIIKWMIAEFYLAASVSGSIAMNKTYSVVLPFFVYVFKSLWETSKTWGLADEQQRFVTCCIALHLSHITMQCVTNDINKIIVIKNNYKTCEYNAWWGTTFKLSKQIKG